MNRDEYGRLKQIVADALLLSPAARAAYVAARCGSDAALRGEAESLLSAAVHAAALYEAPTLLIAGASVGDLFDSAPAEAPFEGTTRYTVRRRIGVGGTGIVYEVDDSRRGQTVALKTLRHLDDAAVYQLKHEFRSLADVAHPNLVALYDLVINEHQCFFTMELVEGMTFVDYIRQSVPRADVYDRARGVLPQLIAGVEELHRRRMQHGDIKPSNVLVTAHGRVVILDFGLTASLQGETPGRRPLAGTPAYVSPEQCLGQAGSPASDWYAVGATLYHALAGHPPFDGAVRPLIHRKTTEDPPPLSRVVPDIPQEISDVCMGLLRRAPSVRMSGREALHRLRAAHPSASVGEPPAAVFVGRQPALDAMCTVFADVSRGRSAAVAIHGPSGIGKSALVQRFIDGARERALVLRSRCHEHEAIPYKGLDGIVDGLARHLTGLPREESLALLPDDASSLAALFPVMRALGIDAPSNRTAVDPIELRRQAFIAFRELLGRIGNRQPLILHIDDFHWADADSVVWVTEILRPPAPSSLLTIISFRSEELGAKPFLRALIEHIGERLTLPLGALTNDEVRQLVDALSPPDRTPDETTIEGIARDSSGNPFLVEALTRHILSGARTPGAASLDEMLTHRLAALPGEARAFLETVALCGRALLPARVFEACGFAGDERPLVARLKAAHLIRQSRSPDLIEMYHDRIRETIAARLSPDAARRMSVVMARVLVAHGDDEPEALFEHYRAAGETALAADQAARAAAKASGVLAFDLAATFYRHALDLHRDGPHRAAWAVGYAAALENAGRPIEAADAYLDAAALTTTGQQIEWRRKAAELLLIGGQIDRGLAASSDVLDAVGMRLARGPRSAMASLLIRRCQLRWRGLEFTAKTELELSPDDLLRIDAAWAISAGLAMVDPIRAAAFNVRQLLRALDVGDPYRIARAMALEAGFSVVGAGLQRSEMFSRRAEILAAKSGHPYVTALTTVWEGIAAFLTGQWRKASALCERAVTMFRDECTGVIWELNMAHNFFLGGLVSQGELRAVSRHLPALLAAARERGNFYLELELNTRMILVWLAGDDPDGAERRGNDGISRWSQRGFQRQHYSHLLMRVQAALYRGRARDAWQLIDGCQRQLRQSRFLRVQHTRIEAANYHARSALAVAAAGEDRQRMIDIASRDVRRLERENRPWSNAFARLLRATLAHLAGDAQAAASGLDAATEAFGSADMHLYACVCRRRLGSLIGGDRGRQLRLDADRWMASQEIRNPAAMARLIAPGLPD